MKSKRRKYREWIPSTKVVPRIKRGKNVREVVEIWTNCFGDLQKDYDLFYKDNKLKWE